MVALTIFLTVHLNVVSATDIAGVALNFFTGKIARNLRDLCRSRILTVFTKVNEIFH